jgi:hypothetical protein
MGTQKSTNERSPSVAGSLGLLGSRAQYSNFFPRHTIFHLIFQLSSSVEKVPHLRKSVEKDRYLL